MFAGLPERVDAWLDAVYREERTVTEMHVNDGEHGTVTVSSVSAGGEPARDEIRLTVEERDSIAATFEDWDQAWTLHDTDAVEGCAPVDRRTLSYDGDAWQILASFRSYRPAPAVDGELGQLLAGVVDDPLVRYTASFDKDGNREDTVKVDTENPQEYSERYDSREAYVSDIPDFLFEEDGESFQMNHTPTFDEDTKIALDEWVRTTLDEMIVATAATNQSVTITPVRLNVGFDGTTKCLFTVEQKLKTN